MAKILIALILDQVGPQWSKIWHDLHYYSFKISDWLKPYKKTIKPQSDAVDQIWKEFCHIKPMMSQ